MNSAELLKVLACPVCHGQLALKKKEDKGEAFMCERCQLLYPIENEIPVMLIDRAIPLSAWMEEEEKS